MTAHLSKWPIYDGMLYTGKPTTFPGMLPTRFIYAADVYPLLHAPSDYGPMTSPNYTKIQSFATALGPSWTTPLIYDAHENFAVGTLAECNTTLGYLQNITNIFRTSCPLAKFGFYGTPLPLREWQSTNNSFYRGVSPLGPAGFGYTAQLTFPPADGEGMPWFDHWKAKNAIFASLAATMDYILPSLYTLYVDTSDTFKAEWNDYAFMNVLEARKYGPPVFPVMWPEYQPAPGNFIPVDLWAQQLNYLRHTLRTDGMMLWSGGSPIFDPTYAWYKQTLQLMSPHSKIAIYPGSGG